MSSFTSRQWVAVAGGTILLASLFFVNRKKPISKAPMPLQTNDSAAGNAKFDSLMEQATKQLTGIAKVKITGFTKALKGAGKPMQVQLYDSVINIFDTLGMQLQASYYMEKVAQLENSAEKWSNSGEGYYLIATLMTPAARTIVIRRASYCFHHAIAIDSTYLDASVGLGQCIVEGGGSPMEGITMILDVLKKDSNNKKAHLALGEFSIQSGQYSKAIEHFKKLLKLSPKFIKAYLYLAQAYESSGDKKTAIIYLKKYSSFATDTSLKRQINDYITKFETDTKKQ